MLGRPTIGRDRPSRFHRSSDGRHGDGAGYDEPSDGIPVELHRRRILIVIANATDHPHLLRQRQLIKSDAAGYRDRDVAIVEIVSGAGTIDGQSMTPGQSQALRSLASITTKFGVALIGRDGGVKLTQSEPVAAGTIFDLIDSMPMRQQEMRDKSR